MAGFTSRSQKLLPCASVTFAIFLRWVFALGSHHSEHISWENQWQTLPGNSCQGTQTLHQESAAQNKAKNIVVKMWSQLSKLVVIQLFFYPICSLHQLFVMLTKMMPVYLLHSDTGLDSREHSPAERGQGCRGLSVP